MRQGLSALKICLKWKKLTKSDSEWGSKYPPSNNVITFYENRKYIAKPDAFTTEEVSIMISGAMRFSQDY